MFFFFNDTATTEIYTLSLHDALPIFERFLLLVLPSARRRGFAPLLRRALLLLLGTHQVIVDRKSTRLNSSHANISYAVFCLKKKQQQCHILHIIDRL